MPALTSAEYSPTFARPTVGGLGIMEATTVSSASGAQARLHDEAPVALLDPAKFRDSRVTARGEPRATVALRSLETLWFNTGSLCNLACLNCYIESTPRNDRLAYLTAAEVGRFLDELDRDWSAREIGFTGGEPFMNPEFPAMLEDALRRGYRVLVLTNAMRPMLKCKARLTALRASRSSRPRPVLRPRPWSGSSSNGFTEGSPRFWVPQREPSQAWLPSPPPARSSPRWAQSPSELARARCVTRP